MKGRLSLLRALERERRVERAYAHTLDVPAHAQLRLGSDEAGNQSHPQSGRTRTILVCQPTHSCGSSSSKSTELVSRSGLPPGAYWSAEIPQPIGAGHVDQTQKEP